MMENFVGMKELYDVSLRLTQPLEIGKKKYDINEAILTFKTAEIAQIQEQKQTISARGGFANSPLIDWDINQEMRFGIKHGVLSPTSWALLSNSKIKEPPAKSIGMIEEVETIEDERYCYVELKYCPNCYDIQLGAQPNPFNKPTKISTTHHL